MINILLVGSLIAVALCLFFVFTVKTPNGQLKALALMILALVILVASTLAVTAKHVMNNMSLRSMISRFVQR